MKKNILNYNFSNEHSSAVASCDLLNENWKKIGMGHRGRTCIIMCAVTGANSKWNKASSYNGWLEFSCPIQIWLDDDWLHFQRGIDWKIPLKDFDCLGWDHMPNPWPVSKIKRWRTPKSTSTGGIGWRGRRNSSPCEGMHSF